jgi:hypothetical protein
MYSLGMGLQRGGDIVDVESRRLKRNGHGPAEAAERTEGTRAL